MTSEGITNAVLVGRLSVLMGLLFTQATAKGGGCLKMGCSIGSCSNCSWREGKRVTNICTNSEHITNNDHSTEALRGWNVQTADPLFLEFGCELCRPCGKKLKATVLEETKNWLADFGRGVKEDFKKLNPLSPLFFLKCHYCGKKLVEVKPHLWKCDCEEGKKNSLSVG